jgi:putative Ca2+/H+ antiporter (TMEM165/GDT1 family)
MLLSVCFAASGPPHCSILAGVFVAYFYNVSLAFCVGTYVLFLSSSWPCANALGPFAQLQNQVPINAVRDYASQVGLSALYSYESD